ncbi:MAG TPA: hypothetical protein VJ021_03370 [Thermoplasmata archaeon]|nr:hypothetical protein [Thermoplasmata archaeon]
MSKASPAENAPSARRAAERLRHLGWVLFGLLVVECVIGIALALYVSLPSSPSFLTVFTSVPLLTAHIALAFLLTIVALYATLLALRLRVPGVAGWEALTTLFLLVAVQEGFAFTFDQNNLYVLGMVVGFLGALVVQGVVIYRLSRKIKGAASEPAPSPGA